MISCVSATGTQNRRLPALFLPSLSLHVPFANCPASMPAEHNVITTPGLGIHFPYPSESQEGDVTSQCSAQGSEVDEGDDYDVDERPNRWEYYLSSEDSQPTSSSKTAFIRELSYGVSDPGGAYSFQSLS